MFSLYKNKRVREINIGWVKKEMIVNLVHKRSNIKIFKVMCISHLYCVCVRVCICVFSCADACKIKNSVVKDDLYSRNIHMVMASQISHVPANHLSSFT